MPRTFHPEHIACIEDTLEDDDNTTVPGTRRSANVAAKRSKPVHDKTRVGSGELVVKHLTTDQSIDNHSFDRTYQQGHKHAPISSGVRNSEIMKPSASKGKEPAEKGRRILDKLKPKSKKSDKAPPMVESREAAARMHISGAPVGPGPPILIQPHPPRHPPIMIPQPFHGPLPPPQGPFLPPLHQTGPTYPIPPPGPLMHSRPASFHAGVSPPMVHPPGYYPARGMVPPQLPMSPPELMQSPFMPGPSPTLAQRPPEYFPPPGPYTYPHPEPPLQRVPSQNRRSVSFVEPPDFQQPPWGSSSFPDGGLINVSRQQSRRRREPRPAPIPGSWDYYEEDRERMDRERIERERIDLERERARMELDRERARMNLDRERINMERLDLERREQQARIDRERMPPPPQIHQTERPPMRRPATVANVQSSHRHSFVAPSPPDLQDEVRLATFRSRDSQIADEYTNHARRHRDSNSSHRSFNRRSLTKKELQRNQEEEEKFDEAKAIKHQEEAVKASKASLSTPTHDDIKRKMQQRSKTQASETGSRASKASKVSRKSGSSEGKKRRDDRSHAGDGEEKMTVSMDANQNLKLDIVGDNSKPRTIEFRPNKDHDGALAISIGGNGQRKEPKYHASISSARSGISHRETIYENEEAVIRPSSSVREPEYVHASNNLRDGPSMRDVDSTRATAGSRRASVSRDPEYVKHTTTSTRRTGSSKETDYREGVRTESRMSRATTTVDDTPRRSREDSNRRDHEAPHRGPPLSGRWAFIPDERPRGSSRASRAPSQSPTEDRHPRSSSRASRVERHGHRRESRVREDPSKGLRRDRSPSPQKEYAARSANVTTITKTLSRSSVPEQSPTRSPQDEDLALVNELATIQISSSKGNQTKRNSSPSKQAPSVARKDSPGVLVRTPSPVSKERVSTWKVQDRSPFLERHTSRGESQPRRRSLSVMPGIRYVTGDKRIREGEPF